MVLSIPIEYELFSIRSIWPIDKILTCNCQIFLLNSEEKKKKSIPAILYHLKIKVYNQKVTAF